MISLRRLQIVAHFLAIGLFVTSCATAPAEPRDEIPLAEISAPASLLKPGSYIGHDDDASVDVESDFYCEPPTNDVVEHINSTLGFNWRTQTPGNATISDIAMVRVGAGNQPEEYWWIVALRNTNPDGREDNRTFLTNSPSGSQPSGETWIQVWPHINIVGPNGERDGWGMVRWPEYRISVGQKAEVIALGCITSDG